MLRQLIFSLSLLFGAQTALAQPSIWDLEVAPSPRLGLAFPGSSTQFYPLLADMGIGVVRVSAAWSRIEPRQGQFDFRGLDSRVAALDALGIAPFITFESDAAWGANFTNVVKNGEPRDLAAWQNFVSQVVERYDMDGVGDVRGMRRPVRYYQVANEFLSPTNRSGGWAGSNIGLINMVNATYDAVKGQDRSTVFVMGGIASFNVDIALLALRNAQFSLEQRWSETSRTVFDRRNLQTPAVRGAIDNRLLPALRNTRNDWVSVHLYGPENRDAARLALVSDLARKPVISSECGGPSRDYGDVYSGQAHYRAVLHRNLNVWAANSAFCLWFGLGESITSTYGNARVPLYDRSGRPKPGTQAYRLLARIAPVMQRVTPIGSDGFQIDTRQGVIYVAFNDAARGQVSGLAGATPTICINDAERRDAVWTTWGAIRENCTNDGISLTGNGLLTVLGG